MTDLYSGLGGGPAPETRREEGRLPPSPPSWTGPVQLPWSRRQPPPGLPLSPESPTRSSRTIPGPLPLSTTQPHFRLSRPLIAIAPGLGARGKRKKKKRRLAGARLCLPLLACRDTLRSGGASSCGESVRLDWAGPLPLFPQRRRPPSRSATPPPVATHRAPALPWPRAQACLQLGRAGGQGASALLPRPDSRVAARRPRVRGARPPPRLAGLGAMGAQRAGKRLSAVGVGGTTAAMPSPGAPFRSVASVHPKAPVCWCLARGKPLWKRWIWWRKSPQDPRLQLPL